MPTAMFTFKDLQAHCNVHGCAMALRQSKHNNFIPARELNGQCWADSLQTMQAAIMLDAG